MTIIQSFSTLVGNPKDKRAKLRNTPAQTFNATQKTADCHVESTCGAGAARESPRGMLIGGALQSLKPEGEINLTRIHNDGVGILAAAALAAGGLLMAGDSQGDDEAAPAGNGGALLLTDFTAETPDLNWYTQNDNVMGGRSKGGYEIVDDELQFKGSTNTRGGGFSSIRTRRFSLDLAGYEGIRVHIKAEGRRYTWQINTNARNSGYPVSYWADFDTPDDEWAYVDIPFSTFIPNFRGFKLDGPALDPGDITEFGLYIYDKKDGPFELHMDSIEAY